MRTTLTLDDDVAERLRLEARQRGRPFREVVNSAIRAGLRSRPEQAQFRVHARPMGLRPGMDLDDVEGLLDLLDGPSRR